MEKSKKAVKGFNMKFYMEETSENKEVSNLRHKSELIQNEKFLEEGSLTKKDLLSLLKDYKISISANKRKDEIKNVLSKKILESDSISMHVPVEENILDLVV